MDNYRAVYDAVAQAYSMAGHRALQAAQAIEYEMTRPTAVFRPALSIDGDMWLALYGENIQDGVVGFGKSPDEATRAFDKAWHEKLTSAAPSPTPDPVSNEGETKGES